VVPARLHPLGARVLMLREVTFPLQLRSPNRRAATWQAASMEVKRTREPTTAVLRSCFGTPPPPRPDQLFTVELIRIAPREFDEHENHRFAFKHVADAITRWLGLPSDSDRRIKGRWKYPPHVRGRAHEHLVRIRIFDDTPGPDSIHILKSVPGAEPPAPRPAKKKSQAQLARGGGIQGQRQLIFVPARIAHPDEQDPDDPDFMVTRDWSEIMVAANYPLTATIVVKGGRRVTMLRHDHFDEELGGRCYLYLEYRPREVKPAWSR
jgi:hypothetical protein